MSFQSISLALSVLVLGSVIFVFTLRPPPYEPARRQYTVSLFVMLLLGIATTSTSAINPHNDRFSRGAAAIAGVAFLCALIILIRKVARGVRIP